MDSYGTVQGFEGFMADEGLSVPTGAGSPSSQVLLRRGSAYLDATYSARLQGAPTGGIDQDLAFPRIDVRPHFGSVVGDTIASDVIPKAVVRATYYAAWYEGNNPGSLAAAASLATQIKVEKAGDTSFEYLSSGNAAADAQVIFPVVEGLMAPFLIRDDSGVALGILALG